MHSVQPSAMCQDVNLLSAAANSERWLWVDGLAEFQWARDIVFYRDGSTTRRIYPHPDCQELKTLWNATDYFFKQFERVLYAPVCSEHDLAFQFWLMDQMFGSNRLPDTSWSMIYFAEYLEHVEGTRPFSEPTLKVWFRSASVKP